MNKKILFLLFSIIFLCGSGFWFFSSQKKPSGKVSFWVQYPEGVYGPFLFEQKKVSEALEESGFVLAPQSLVFPDRESLLQNGTIIVVSPAKKVLVEYDGKTEEYLTPAHTVEEALVDLNITVRPEDIIHPTRESVVMREGVIEIVRVTTTEEKKEEKIAFKKIEEEDDKLSWQTKKVVQKGEAGIKTTYVEVSRHNNKVVAEKILREEITKEPVDEKTVVGTKVTVVKKHSGGASWYAHTGTLSAANPWLPFGSYVRVTNKANGKNVIVKINDRGPFGPGRIIDLDKVAFAKIADLGTGVIDVLMEEIK